MLSLTVTMMLKGGLAFDEKMETTPTHHVTALMSKLDGVLLQGDVEREQALWTQEALVLKMADIQGKRPQNRRAMNWAFRDPTDKAPVNEEPVKEGEAQLAESSEDKTVSCHHDKAANLHPQ